MLPILRWIKHKVVSRFQIQCLFFSLGNEALFSLETASDYVKDDKASFFGFKCFAIGYEFSPGPDEVRMNYRLILLRNIVFLRATIDLNLFAFFT